MTTTPRPGSSWYTLPMHQEYHNTKERLRQAIWYWTGVRPK